MEQLLKVDIEIERKINILKQQLQELLNTHYYEVYTLLKKILILRQGQIDGYDIKDLHKEKGIDLSDDQVRYYVGFKYISPRSKKLIAQGKLKGSTFLFIMRKSVTFRDHIIQDNIIKKYLSGEINSSIISYGDIDKIISGDLISDVEDKGYKILYRLKEIKRAIEINVEILKSDKIRNLISNEIAKINILLNKNKLKGIKKLFSKFSSSEGVK